MRRQEVRFINASEDTYYLVGPEGLVWVEAAGGEQYIVAANNPAERRTATIFLGQLLDMGLIPYGMPLLQRVFVNLFGGKPTRDCHWVHHTKAPPPIGQEGGQCSVRPAVPGILE
jgi:hypothetical protein